MRVCGVKVIALICLCCPLESGFVRSIRLETCASNSSNLSLVYPYFGGGPPRGGPPNPRTASSRGDSSSRGSSFDGKARDRSQSRSRSRSEGDDRSSRYQSSNGRRKSAPAAGSDRKSRTGSSSRSSLGGRGDKISWDDVLDRTTSWNWLEADPPDWQWHFAKKDTFRSYSVQESIDLERYYQVHRKTHRNEALVTLSRKKVLVNFEKMVASTQSYKWALKRNLKFDWLNSAYFFAAFTESVNSSKSKKDIEEMFDFRYNQDYRGFTHSPKMKRGGEPYEIPMGWKRFAVNVSHFPAEGDSNWLGDDDNSWAVCYHGTAKANLPGILKEGFMIGEGQKFDRCLGKGVYCANSIDVAQHYSYPEEFKRHWIQVVLQVRVKPKAIKYVATCTDAIGIERSYWVINNQAGLRHYGVLVRELHPTEYLTPREMVYGPEDRPQDMILLKRDVFERTWPGKDYEEIYPYMNRADFNDFTIKYGRSCVMTTSIEFHDQLPGGNNRRGNLRRWF